MSLVCVADNYHISVSDFTEYDVMQKSGNYISIPSDTTFGGEWNPLIEKWHFSSYSYICLVMN